MPLTLVLPQACSSDLPTQKSVDKHHLHEQRAGRTIPSATSSPHTHLHSSKVGAVCGKEKANLKSLLFKYYCHITNKRNNIVYSLCLTQAPVEVTKCIELAFVLPFKGSLCTERNTWQPTSACSAEQTSLIQHVNQLIFVCKAEVLDVCLTYKWLPVTRHGKSSTRTLLIASFVIEMGGVYLCFASTSSNGFE